MPVWTQDARLAYKSYLKLVGLQAIPLGIILTLQSSYLTIYATDELLIAPAVVGTLFALARLYDGVTDVLLGWWSDRCSGEAGRRRPFVLLGALSMIPFAFLWLPPEGLGGLQLVLFFGVALLLFESLSTLLLVPYYALGIESARTPRQRAFAASLGRAVGVAGVLVGVIVMQKLINSDDARAEAVPYVLAIVAASLLAIWLGARQIRELRLPQKCREGSPWRQLRDAFSIRYFRQFMVVHGAEMFCYASLGFGAAYVMRYIVHAPEYTMAVLMGFHVTMNVTPLFWLPLLRRLGVLRVWLLGQGLWVLVLLSFPLVFLWGMPAYLAMALLGGVATGAANCAKPAVLGDIVDHDARRSGRQRQGAYMTLFLLVGKIVSAAAAFALGWLLQLSGFVPREAQEAPALIAIALSVSALPLVAILWSVRLLLRFDLYRDTGRCDGRQLASGPMGPGLHPKSIT